MIPRRKKPLYCACWRAMRLLVPMKAVRRDGWLLRVSVPSAIWVAALLLVACDGNKRAENKPAVPRPSTCWSLTARSEITLTEELICDARADCKNVEDEVDCPGVFICMGSGSTVEPSAIPEEQVCDGVANCRRADDEEDCLGSDVMFCASDDEAGRKVYSPAQKCDGKRDCFFAEDEKGCPDTFLCQNSWGPGVEKVIPLAKVCDGVKDCWNDESRCEGE